MSTTSRTRYFVIASLLVLTVGVGTGLVAYYVGFVAGASSGNVDELKFVPQDASLVAYADVHAVMVSEVRQRILQLLPTHGSGQQEFENQTGIKIDTDIDHVVACLLPIQQRGSMPVLSGMLLARGRFNPTKIESLMRDHGARVEEYKGSRLLIADAPRSPAGTGTNSVSLAFLEPGLVAVGSTDVIRVAADLKNPGPGVTTITGNDEIMNVVRSYTADNLWVVGRFDTLTAQVSLPPAVANQIPAISLFAADARVNGGIAGTLRVDGRDDQAATNLRDLLRGVVAFARLQTGSRAELQPMLDSLQLGGTGKSVTLSFDVSAQTFGAIADSFHGSPQRRPAPPR